MKRRTALLLSTTLLLGACSSMRIVDSDVSSFPSPAGQAIPAAALYRFERLPSQQAQPQQSAALEALAQAALERAGMRLGDAAAPYSVQLSLTMFRDPQAPWDDPRYVQGFARPFAAPSPYGTVLRHPSLDLRFDYPYYRRELAIVIRHMPDAQVVFETRARHDGRWPDDAGVLPAMFEAALQGFPSPATGVRHVVVEVPR